MFYIYAQQWPLIKIGVIEGLLILCLESVSASRSKDQTELIQRATQRRLNDVNVQSTHMVIEFNSHIKTKHNNSSSSGDFFIKKFLFYNLLQFIAVIRFLCTPASCQLAVPFFVQMTRDVRIVICGSAPRHWLAFQFHAGMDPSVHVPTEACMHVPELFDTSVHVWGR